jgi:hypothetical protein
VVVNLTSTQFCDSSGVRVLARAHERAVAEGGELLIVIPARAFLLRVFAFTGLDPPHPQLRARLTGSPQRGRTPPCARPACQHPAPEAKSSSAVAGTTLSGCGYNGGIPRVVP